MRRQLVTQVEPHYKCQHLGLVVNDTLVDASLAYAAVLANAGHALIATIEVLKRQNIYSASSEVAPASRRET
jgi:hypothetical protein